jgi:cytochrome c oxidase subunit 4
MAHSKAAAHDSHHSNPHIEDTHDPGHHIVPVSTYIKVILSLMVLLIITLAAAAVDFSAMAPGNAFFGALNIIIAMTIAVIKAVLIILYFMHVRYSSKLVWVFAGAAFYWVVILFVLTMTDYMSRYMTNYPGQYTF